MTYYIELWLGAERVALYDDTEYRSSDDAREYIHRLLNEMLNDGSPDDWTGCRFEVATQDGRTVLQVPVLATMSAIARRRCH